ncbi:MAG: TIGR02453 family protein [Flavobacteriales bacterium]|nr:MAG: TIGR02453 family protein [Flavobacteriales bacterium]
MTKTIPPTTFDFLNRLKNNNNRDWFNNHKPEFKQLEKELKSFFTEVFNGLNEIDKVDKMKIFRIYRDVRFSHDKTPYKTHFGCSFHRLKPRLRGGYYIHITPNESFLATGFWNPNKQDLQRIREEFESDAGAFRKIINDSEFKKIWGALKGEEVKTAPKGFNRIHKNIDLIKKKQYFFTKKYSEEEVLSEDFFEETLTAFSATRPYLNYMSEILTKDLNGMPLYE